MSEREVIERTEFPATVASLVADLRRLGVENGMTLMVHSSLSRLGFVAGGEQAVVTALLEAVGDDGTVMMPTHSSHLGDPGQWQHPPAPSTWWATLRDATPAFDPRLSPTRAMGAIVECFRHVPGVRRSDHPTVSAAAVGPHAAVLVGDHALDHGLGEGSPQARLYELDGHILLLGVTHANNTSLHLSEYRGAGPDAPMNVQHSPVLVDGRREWVAWTELENDDEDFERVGEAFDETGLQRRGGVGAGDALLMRARDLVDFAAEWMSANRTAR